MLIFVALQLFQAREFPDISRSAMRMKSITDYLEKEQVDQVLGAAHQCSAREYRMLRMLWRTGVRVNELLTITPRDIEPHNNVMNVTTVYLQFNDRNIKGFYDKTPF